MSGRGGLRVALAVGAALTLAVCASTPPKPSPAGTSKPGATHRPRKPSRAATPGQVQRGQATWYARGKMTASGERFDKRKHTAAHRTLPFGTMVRVTHRRTGRSVVVRINDRGPFGNKRRIIDLAWGAARELGILDEGVAPVTVEVIGQDAAP